MNFSRLTLLLQLCIICNECVAHISINEDRTYFEYSFRDVTIVNSPEKSIIRHITNRTQIDVYSALFGQIRPVSGFNDVALRWAGHTDWTFEYGFRLDLGNDSRSWSTQLELDRLSAGARVTLNGHHVFTVNNQFTRHVIDLNDDETQRFVNLGGKSNTLNIRFESLVRLANETARRRYAADGGRPIQPVCWPRVYHGECHVNQLRIMQASFGWDWGPAIPTVGVFGGLKLIGRRGAFTRAKIADVQFFSESVERQCRAWSANARITLHINSSGALNSSRLCIRAFIRDLANSTLNNCVPATDNTVNITLLSGSTSPRLWWPNGYGQPATYTLVVELIELTTTNPVSTIEIDSKHLVIGFRQVEIDQTELATPAFNQSRLFQFRVNCVPIFVRGTNMIPRRLFTAHAHAHTPADHHAVALLNSVRLAHMNMVRVWGGGVYETDEFYRTASRLGIMIWQDFMFACALYPADTEYRRVVADEVDQIVRATQHHPSVVVWAGNNENEAVVAQGWYGETPMDPRNLRAYSLLYQHTVQTRVHAVTGRSRPFLLSSPSNGVFSQNRRDSGVSPDPQSCLSGDVHSYVYAGGHLWSADAYPISRMTSEFGFQSLPSLPEWRVQLSAVVACNESGSATAAQFFMADGALMRHRQHHPNGMQQMWSITESYLSAPWHTANHQANYSRFAYWTQINQAMVYRAHVSQLISHQSSFNRSTGLGRSSGVMFWQLNDVWSAPTWSAIEPYFLTWKPVHYAMRRIFEYERYANGAKFRLLATRHARQPLRISIFLIMLFDESKTARQLHAVLPDQSSIDVYFSCYHLDGLRSVNSVRQIRKSFDLHVTDQLRYVGGQARRDFTLKLWEISAGDLASNLCRCDSVKSCFVRISLSNTENVEDESILLDRPKNLDWAKHGSSHTLTLVKHGSCANSISSCCLTLSNRNTTRMQVYLFVYLTAEDHVENQYSENPVIPAYWGYFSHNFFHFTSKDSPLEIQYHIEARSEARLDHGRICATLNFTLIALGDLYTT